MNAIVVLLEKWVQEKNGWKVQVPRGGNFLGMIRIPRNSGCKKFILKGNGENLLEEDFEFAKSVQRKEEKAITIFPLLSAICFSEAGYTCFELWTDQHPPVQCVFVFKNDFFTLQKWKNPHVIKMRSRTTQWSMFQKIGFFKVFNETKVIRPFDAFKHVYVFSNVQFVSMFKVPRQFRKSAMTLQHYLIKTQLLKVHRWSWIPQFPQMEMFGNFYHFYYYGIVRKVQQDRLLKWLIFFSK
jgi:hypothetical protein